MTNGFNNNNEGHFGGPSGKGNPPEKYQFKKGQSGNPKGRPKKKASTFESDLKDILTSEVVATDKVSGKQIKITKRKLLLDQIISLGIKGNPTMARLALPLLKIGDENPEFEVLPEDKAILEDLMKNLGYDDGNNS